MRAFCSCYELVPRSTIGRLARPGPRVGALLRLEHEGIGPGYADCHPWPELGDAPLGEQLGLLARGELTPLTRQSVKFSLLDARARARGRNLWEGLEIPPSHELLTDLTQRGIEEALERGFDRIKIKLGAKVREETDFLSRAAGLLRGKAKLRLDFNEALDAAEFGRFLSALTPEDSELLDFIEDPIAWSPEHGFPSLEGAPRLALDRGTLALSPHGEALCPEVLVIKPATNRWEGLLELGIRWKRAMVFTSYLDHPLGQLQAAWAAASAASKPSARIETCGLLSHDAYEENPFSAALQTRGPRLDPPEGTGFGWGELLARQEWKELR